MTEPIQISISATPSGYEATLVSRVVDVVGVGATPREAIRELLADDDPDLADRLDTGGDPR